MIVTIGAKGDPHIARLCSRLDEAGHPHQDVVIEENASPRLTWDVQTRDLVLDGRDIVAPVGIFLRYPDAGESAMTPSSFFRAKTWYMGLVAWILDQPDVQFMNRFLLDRPLHKPHVLNRAARAGLEVPETLITNDFASLSPLPPDEYVVKPILGGLSCTTLREALEQAGSFRDGAAAAPAIVQKRLGGSDYRVYCIGSEIFGFEIERLDPDLVDYRLAQSEDQIKVSVWSAIPKSIENSLRTLADYYCLDFYAADFRMDQPGGRLFFLDLNEAPSFQGCDVLAGGTLTDAMIRWLTKARRARSSHQTTVQFWSSERPRASVFR